VKHPAHHAKEIGKRVFCEEWGVENDDQVECAVQNVKDCYQEEPVLDLVGEHRWESLEWLAWDLGGRAQFLPRVYPDRGTGRRGGPETRSDDNGSLEAGGSIPGFGR